MSIISLRAWTAIAGSIFIAILATQVGMAQSIAESDQGLTDPQKWLQEYREATREAARAAVNAFIEAASDSESLIKVAKYYCSYYLAIPVKNASLVQAEYATRSNCVDKGLPALHKLAQAGDVHAQLELADYLNSVISIFETSTTRPPSDDAEALKWYLEVASKAQRLVHSELSAKSSQLPNEGQVVQAAGWVARFYEDGISVTKDLEAAFHWHSVAASLGSEPDIIRVTSMIGRGEGTKKDMLEAIRRLSKLPQNEEAQFRMAELLCFYDSQTADRGPRAKNIFESLRLHSKRRDIRHASAFYLGQMLYYGTIMKRDYKSAFDYLIEAGRYGEPQAQNIVATLYLTGLGVVQSYSDAFVWAAIAASNGSEDAVQTRNTAEAHLSTPELAVARSRASGWGKGGNSEAYECKTKELDGLDFDIGYYAKFVIDLDTWNVKIIRGKSEDDADMSIIGDEIRVRVGQLVTDYTINRKTREYTETNNGPVDTAYHGICRLIDGATGDRDH